MQIGYFCHGLLEARNDTEQELVRIVQLANIAIVLVAIFASGYLAPPVASVMARITEKPEMTLLVTFLVVFLIIAIPLRLVAFWTRGSLRKLNAGILDKMGGASLGALKGFLICIVISIAVTFPPSGRLHNAARQSTLMPYLAHSAKAVRIWVSRRPLKFIREYIRNRQLDRQVPSE